MGSQPELHLDRLAWERSPYEHWPSRASLNDELARMPHSLAQTSWRSADPQPVPVDGLRAQAVRMHHQKDVQWYGQFPLSMGSVPILFGYNEMTVT